MKALLRDGHDAAAVDAAVPLWFSGPADLYVKILDSCGLNQRVRVGSMMPPRLFFAAGAVVALCLLLALAFKGYSGVILPLLIMALVVVLGVIYFRLLWQAEDMAGKADFHLDLYHCIRMDYIDFPRLDVARPGTPDEAALIAAIRRVWENARYPEDFGLKPQS